MFGLNEPIERFAKPTVSERIFISKDTYNSRDNNGLQHTEFQTVNTVFSYFVSSDRDCGMPFQQRSSSLKRYTTLRKISLNGAFRVNLTSSSYNDTHHILLSTRNLSYYFISFISSRIYIQLSCTRLCQVILAQVCICSCPVPDHGACARPIHTLYISWQSVVFRLICT